MLTHNVATGLASVTSASAAGVQHEELAVMAALETGHVGMCVRLGRQGAPRKALSLGRPCLRKLTFCDQAADVELSTAGARQAGAARMALGRLRLGGATGRSQVSQLSSQAQRSSRAR